MTLHWRAFLDHFDFIGGLFWTTLTLLAGFSGQLLLYWLAFLDNFDFIGELFWTPLTLLAGFSCQL